MAFLRFPFFIVVLLLIVTLGYLIWYVRELGRARKEISAVFERVEGAYLSFIKKRMTLVMIEEERLEDKLDTIKAETIQVLRPEIESLWALIERDTYQNMRLQINPEVFVSARILIEKFSRANFSTLDEAQKQQYHDQLMMAFQDGIMADLTQRNLAFRTGEKFVP